MLHFILQFCEFLSRYSIKTAGSRIFMLTKRAVLFTTSKALLNYAVCNLLGQMVVLFRRYWKLKYVFCHACELYRERKLDKSYVALKVRAT